MYWYNIIILIQNRTGKPCFPIYVLVRFNLLLLPCYQRLMVDNYDTLRGMVYHANKISPQRNVNLGLLLAIRRDTMWTVKDDTGGTPARHTAPILENVICRTCTDNVAEELRTPHIENATGDRFTTKW